MTAKDAELVGQLLLGRYRVVQALGQGGMGFVYLARVEGAAGFAIPVVVKTISPQLIADPTMEKMFVREARILSYLKHANIVGVVDFGNTPAGYVLVIEYVHGYHLGQWAKFLRFSQRAFDVDYALFALVQVLDALEYAHTLKRADGTELAIVHRDVSPSNVLIDLSGKVKLYDFGIARMTEDPGEFRTEAGVFKGTLSFSAPELVQGGPASAASDVYAAAVVLYQLLAGENPFTGRELRETLHRVLTVDPPPVHERRPGLPIQLSAVIARALHKDRAVRQATAAEFAKQLRMFLSRPEEEVALRFASAVQEDFAEALPKTLGIEALDARDAAWRAALDVPNEQRASLRLQVAKRLDSSPAPANADGTQVPPAKGFRVTGSESPTIQAAVVSASTTTSPKPRARRTRRTAGLLLGAALGLGVTVTVTLLIAKQLERPDAKPKFLFIEKRASQPSSESQEGSAPPAVAAPSSSPVSSPPGAPSGRGKALTPATSAEPERSLASQLSATFQQGQGRLEQCFQRFATDVDGRPQVSVQFQLAASGTVSGAHLSPAALEATPLGECLLSVARSTRFQKVDAPLTFSIPLTARRMSR